MKKLILFLAGWFLLGGARAQNPKLTITHLTGDYYVYVTYGDAGGGNLYPSNSLYVVTTAGIVLMDTPWDTTQFQPLLDSLEARHHQRPVFCISTHFHEDRTAGLDFLKQHGVATWSTVQTRELCRQHNKPQAEYVFTGDMTFMTGNHSFRAFYPGEGHTKDNIVVWFGDEKILYGGCLVKSIEATDLGNVADANTQAYPATIKNVMKTFPHPVFVIPGHLGGTGEESLSHTLMLAEKYNREKAVKKP